MGYRIWRKDNNAWSLAFDTIYETQDKVNDAIAELNARYHDMIKYGELQFLPYLEHVNLNRDGSVKEPFSRKTNGGSGGRRDSSRRKVRAPQGRTPGNSRLEQSRGKCNRKQTAQSNG